MVSPAASAGRLGSALPFLLVLLDLQYQGEAGWGLCRAALRVGLCRGPSGLGPRPWWRWLVSLPPSLLPELRGVRHGGGAHTPNSPAAFPGLCRGGGLYFGQGCERGSTALPAHRSGLWRGARNERTAAAGDLLGLVGDPGGALGGGSLCACVPGLLPDGLGLPPATAGPRVPWCPRVQLGNSIGLLC